MEIDNAPTVYRVLAGVLGEKDLEYIHYGFKSEKLKNNFEGWLQLRTE